MNILGMVIVIVVAAFGIALVIGALRYDWNRNSEDYSKLYMMVQECNQRYAELKARVDNLEKKEDEDD